jgi:hypothetical protein
MNMNRFKSTSVSLVALSVLLAACGGGDSATETTVVSSVPGADTTIPVLDAPDVPGAWDGWLTISDVGGFVPVEFSLTNVPRFVVDPDGVVYFPVDDSGIFSATGVPEVRFGEVDQDALAELTDLIEASGLDQVVDEYNNDAASRVADLPDTVFSYVDGDGVVHEFRVYALGTDGVELSDDRITVLEELRDRLDSIVASVESQPYVPETLDVWVTHSRTRAEVATPSMPWPLEEAFGDLSQTDLGFRCATVSGDAATALLDTLSAEKDDVTFDDGSGNYQLFIDPLLPGETSSCAA